MVDDIIRESPPRVRWLFCTKFLHGIAATYFSLRRLLICLKHRSFASRSSDSRMASLVSNDTLGRRFHQLQRVLAMLFASAETFPSTSDGPLQSDSSIDLQQFCRTQSVRLHPEKLRSECTPLKRLRNFTSETSKNDVFLELLRVWVGGRAEARACQGPLRILPRSQCTR